MNFNQESRSKIVDTASTISTQNTKPWNQNGRFSIGNVMFLFFWRVPGKIETHRLLNDFGEIFSQMIDLFLT